MAPQAGRLNDAAEQVLDVLVRHPRGEYGLSIAAEARLAPAAAHAALAGLERIGWIESWWRDDAGSGAGADSGAGPAPGRRRYYSITADAAAPVRQALDRAVDAHRQWVRRTAPAAAS